MNLPIATPMISILMPCFNAEPFIAEAIQSILGQTFQNWELIIVDDGSTDQSREVVRGIADPRIQLHALPKNIGLIQALNHGLNLCRAPYIARMDADDRSHPSRLERQYQYLQEHPEVDLVGTGVRNFKARPDGTVQWESVRKPPQTQDEIQAQLVFYSSIAHATVLMKRGVVDALHPLYSRDFPHAEDYELWTRLANKGFQLRNLVECLYDVRLHPASVSHRENALQKEITHRIREIWRTRLGLPVDSPLAEVHHQISTLYFISTLDFLDTAEASLLELISANQNRPVASHSALQANALEFWYSTCSQLWSLGLTSWRHYFRSKIHENRLVAFLSPRSWRILAKALILPRIS